MRHSSQNIESNPSIVKTGKNIESNPSIVKTGKNIESNPSIVKTGKPIGECRQPSVGNDEGQCDQII